MLPCVDGNSTLVQLVACCHRWTTQNIPWSNVNSLRPRDSYICASKIIPLVSDNGLLPGRRQSIIWTNAGILLIGHLVSSFSGILIKINIVHSQNAHEDDSLSPGRRKAVIWTNTLILLIGPLQYSVFKTYIYFHSRKCTWMCHLQNGVYFV